MNIGLKIKIMDVDDDYLGVELHASNSRFAGTTYIYAGLDDLSNFATRVLGFPQNSKDERTYEFGTLDPKIAGGYCSIRFYCVDGAGHTAVDILMEDDRGLHSSANAKLSFRVHAADIDQFVVHLQALEEKKIGEAILVIAA